MEADSSGAARRGRRTRSAGNGARAEVRQSSGGFLPGAIARPGAQTGRSRQSTAKAGRHQRTSKEGRRKKETGKAKEKGKRAFHPGGFITCRGSPAKRNRARSKGGDRKAASTEIRIGP